MRKGRISLNLVVSKAGLKHWCQHMTNVQNAYADSDRNKTRYTTLYDAHKTLQQRLYEEQSSRRTDRENSQKTCDKRVKDAQSSENLKQKIEEEVKHRESSRDSINPRRDTAEMEPPSFSAPPSLSGQTQKDNFQAPGSTSQPTASPSLLSQIQTGTQLRSHKGEKTKLPPKHKTIGQDDTSSSSSFSAPPSLSGQTQKDNFQAPGSTSQPTASPSLLSQIQTGTQLRSHKGEKTKLPPKHKTIGQDDTSSSSSFSAPPSLSGQTKKDNFQAPGSTSQPTASPSLLSQIQTGTQLRSHKGEKTKLPPKHKTIGQDDTSSSSSFSAPPSLSGQTKKDNFQAPGSTSQPTASPSLLSQIQTGTQLRSHKGEKTKLPPKHKTIGQDDTSSSSSFSAPPSLSGQTKKDNFQAPGSTSQPTASPSLSSQIQTGTKLKSIKGESSVQDMLNNAMISRRGRWRPVYEEEDDEFEEKPQFGRMRNKRKMNR